MSLGVEKVWLKDKNGDEVLVSANKVNVGDNIVLRTSNMIPLDGEVIDGGVTVNQSAITGESVAVNKTVGSRVYAGTVVESGECIIKVTQINGQGKYDRIVKMIEDSEKLNHHLKAKHQIWRINLYRLAYSEQFYICNYTKCNKGVVYSYGGLFLCIKAYNARCGFVCYQRMQQL